MAEATTQSTLEGGSYEVIRARVQQHAATLGERAEALNGRRKQEFGGQELTVIGNDRVRTEHNCVPRNIVPVGGHLLMGFNVYIGLKQERTPADMFSLHSFARTEEGGFDFSPVAFTEAGGFLADRRFAKDFEELTRYYKDTRLLKITRTDERLLMIFQTGQSARDVRVLRFSLDQAGLPTYIDSRGEPDLPRARTHDFEWTAAGRDREVTGRFPHLNILDELFVESTGGDLTVKVENNTSTGAGIYSEPVQEPDQSLDDAQFFFAKVGVFILLKILPFREETWRYLVFNTRTRQVKRIDNVGVSCVALPEDQGLIFPGGYALQTGEVKLFEGDPAGFAFNRAVRSPNGEDVLYVFYEPGDGQYVLFPWNLVRKEVQNPIACHGYSLFPDGQMVTFKSTSNDPTRVHPVQVWQTPFLAAEVAAARPVSQTALGKIGNAELVRGISEVLTLKRMAMSEEPTRQLWEDLAQACQRTVDAFYWLGQRDVGLLDEVRALQKSSELIIDEFEKVLSLQRRAFEELKKAEEEWRELKTRLSAEDLRSTDAFMTALTTLRTQRGRLISLKEVRYVDVTRLEAMEQENVETFERLSRECVDFLSGDAAFAPLNADIDRVGGEVEAVTRTVDLTPLAERLEAVGKGLDVLGEVVGGLQVGDPVQRAGILEAIGDVFSRLNRVRAGAQGKKKELLGKERRAEFGAQFKLLSQSIESALALADSPEKCDEQLSRLTLQLEELEGRFSEFDEFAASLAEKREELFEAFGARKQTLLDERNRRAQNLFGAGERILQGVARRAKTLGTEDELNSYFAGDPMLEKLRALAKQLLDLGDSVKADELDTKLKTARQDALRGLRDKQDLFEGGAAVIKLGAHRFNVNTQPLELTVLPKDDGLWLHLTGTDFNEKLEDPRLSEAKHLWEQTLPSESASVARAEFLAASVLFAAEEGRDGLSLAKLKAAQQQEEGLLEVTRAWAAERYDEGYERGVHDADAARVLEVVLTLRDSAGLLRFGPAPRAWATLYWGELEEAGERAVLHRRAMSLGRLRDAYQKSRDTLTLGDELGGRIAAFLTAAKLAHTAADARIAGRYLAEELVQESPHFTVSADAVALRDDLLLALDQAGRRAALEDDLAALEGHLADRYHLAVAWLTAHVERGGDKAAALRHALPEAAALLTVDESALGRATSAALVTGTATGLLGAHARVQERKLVVRLDEFLGRLSDFAFERAPAFQRFRAQVRELLDVERRRLRLDELVPKVLSSFVRNRLIDEVYLPLIGTNLAKQLGAAGETKRTDRMGMLLLISPPGYGKTTLMEYVAARLGLTFVKVNGPALGHEVVSLDPNDAPNSTARQEVERINFAFELGNNVMLYLDDIQHTNPELLQKFISLCDATRRVEGVWGGRTRTYDLRGKKFCVVMAGNPYTEAGERFRIPDMLANRADTYNLGDILEGKEHLFALSYLENALTSSPALSPLATRPAADLHKIIRMAQGEDIATTDLEHGYSAVELQEMVAVFQRLFKVQKTLLKVNLQYIQSASQDDRFRTEPPFKLQGSYRNMNKLAEKVVSAMTDAELEQLVDAHYQSESQTLTTAAEQNLLKLAELRGRLTQAQRARWDELKRGYKRVQTMGGAEDDPVVRVTGTLGALGEELALIKEAVVSAASRPPPAITLPAPVVNLPAPNVSMPAPVVNVPAPNVSMPAPVVNLPPLDLGASVGPQLEGIQKAVVQLAKSLSRLPAAAPAAKSESADVTPLLIDRLTEVVQAVSSRPVELHASGLSADEVTRQLNLLRDALLPLEWSARQTLQKDSDGAMKAVTVWQQVKQALDLLRTLSTRGGKPSP